MEEQTRPLALVTGASTGIGQELAKCCAKHGFDLLIVAEEDKIHEAGAELRALGVRVDTVQADLARSEGIDQLLSSLGDRPVDALLANAGRGLGDRFFEQNWDDIRHVVDTNVIGTVQLVHRVGQRMRERNQGRILITGSIAGIMPGAYHTVYNATKAFLDNFTIGLRAELTDSNLTVTCLIPGPTETSFFERAHLTTARVATMNKDDPSEVAQSGFDAMMAGKAHVVTGWQNKLQVAVARLSPPKLIAKVHGKLMEPGSARRAG